MTAPTHNRRNLFGSGSSDFGRIRWVPFVLMLVVLGACDSAPAGEPALQAVPESADPHRGPASASAHVHHEQVGDGEHTGHSIYNLSSQWWDQHDDRRELGSLAGRTQVVAMVYTHCSFTCPKILMDMKRLEGQTNDVGFVLVSIDPERDTADRLSYFAEATRLDPARWTLLSGSDGDILELATLLGIKFRRDSETDFSHSNTMLVLNPQGEIVFRQEGLGEDLEPLLTAIGRASGR